MSIVGRRGHNIHQVWVDRWLETGLKGEFHGSEAGVSGNHGRRWWIGWKVLSRNCEHKVKDWSELGGWGCVEIVYRGHIVCSIGDSESGVLDALDLKYGRMRGDEKPDSCSVGDQEADREAVGDKLVLLAVTNQQQLKHRAGEFRVQSSSLPGPVIQRNA